MADQQQPEPIEEPTEIERMIARLEFQFLQHARMAAFGEAGMVRNANREAAAEIVVILGALNQQRAMSKLDALRYDEIADERRTSGNEGGRSA